jgi:hypothetical protein
MLNMAWQTTAHARVGLAVCGALGLIWAGSSCGSRDRRPIGKALSVVSSSVTGTGGGLPTSTSGVGFGSGSGSGGSETENVIPDPDAPCDKDIAIDDAEPLRAAAALGICKIADLEDDTSWGIVSARWSMVNGAVPIDVAPFHLGHGVLPSFGNEVIPLEGERILVLSSGTARRPGDPDYSKPQGFDKKYGSPPPQGFPKESPTCPGVVTGPTRDDIALELELRPPPGAQSIAFDFDFFTWEWPDYVCSTFNDFFVALLEPFPAKQTDGNISFDSENNPVSVNNGLVRVCTCDGGPPCNAPPVNPLKSYDCKLGHTRLAGTGFEGHAATGWLRTKAPVNSGSSFKLRFGIYDSGDGVLDSTVLIDNFRWLGDPSDGPGTRPK